MGFEEFSDFWLDNPSDPFADRSAVNERILRYQRKMRFRRKVGIVTKNLSSVQFEGAIWDFEIGPYSSSGSSGRGTILFGKNEKIQITGDPSIEGVSNGAISL